MNRLVKHTFYQPKKFGNPDSSEEDTLAAIRRVLPGVVGIIDVLETEKDCDGYDYEVSVGVGLVDKLGRSVIHIRNGNISVWEDINET